MLSHLTLAAIDALNTISGMSIHASLERSLPPEDLSILLDKLETGGLICLQDGAIPGILSAYQLARPSVEISLLNVLEATGEHLNCNHDTRIEMYEQYRSAAVKLGIINQMTRKFLSEISLNDF